ncbi:hypothetical protein Hanom_Chr13g01196541 [Helianthus anomalus]
MFQPSTSRFFFIKTFNPPKLDHLQLHVFYNAQTTFTPSHFYLLDFQFFVSFMNLSYQFNTDRTRTFPTAALITFTCSALSSNLASSPNYAFLPANIRTLAIIQFQSYSHIKQAKSHKIVPLALVFHTRHHIPTLTFDCLQANRYGTTHHSNNTSKPHNRCTN